MRNNRFDDEELNLMSAVITVLMLVILIMIHDELETMFCKTVIDETANEIMAVLITPIIFKAAKFELITEIHYLMKKDKEK